MERWSALMPDRASGGGGQSHSSSHSQSRYHVRTSRGLIPLPAYPSRSQFIGPFPAEAWIVIMQFLPVPDLPQLLLCNKRLAALGKDDRLWRVKLAWLDYKGPGAILGWRDRGKGQLTASIKPQSEAKGSPAQEPYRDQEPARPIAPPAAPSDAAAAAAATTTDAEDDFGDFLEVGDHDDDGVAVGSSRRTCTGGADDEDGFGAFQDSDGAGNDPFGLVDGFSDVALEPTRPDPAIGPSAHLKTSTAAAVADDLLVLFDDEADGVLAASQGTLSGVAAQDTHHEADSAGTPVNGRSRASTLSLRRPPAVSHLTFATPPVLASPRLVDASDRSAGAASTSSGGTFSFSQGTWTDEGSTASTVADGLTPPVARAGLSSRTNSSTSSMGFPAPITTSVPTASDPEHTVVGPLLHVYQKHVSLLLPFYTSLQTQSTSSLVFTVSPPLSPLLRARLLASLLRFTHPLCAPTRSRPQRVTVQRNIQSATDFFESTLLAEFARADDGTGPAAGGKAEGGRDEEVMKDKAAILWELNASTTLSQVFVQKRETMFGTGHDPLRNLVKITTPSGTRSDGIDFSAMDEFMTSTLAILTSEGSLIARVFPPEADVLLYFLERIANDVVSDYITSLLAAAQPLQHPLFLLATAATFGQVYRLVDKVLEIEPKNERVTKDRAEDVVFRMFEPLMDDYLQEEGEWIRQVLEGICDEWDQKTAHDLAVSDPTFLASQNPAQVKRNVLAGFTKVLLLPVTIIPKTAEFGLNAITYGATGVIDTFASLGNQLSSVAAPSSSAAAKHQRNASVNSATTPTTTYSTAEAATPASIYPNVPIESSAEAWGGGAPERDLAPGRLSIDANGHIGLINEAAATTAPVLPTAAVAPTRAAPGRFDRLQLLLSLDTALQLIQADRDSLKRIQTFIRYPGLYGRKVRDAIEEVFLVLLQVLSEKHVCPAFAQATQQMAAYRPAEHEDEAAVAPLVQFFELVHIGDTIQQMVDVYFDKEMATYIDRRDFLNAVVREKKKFEAALDDAVAQGLNAAVNILMASVEHLITTRQGLRDFTPDRDDDFDLTPTRACTDAIETLKQHCDMLRGSTDKQILEVFNQEVGIRLHGILLKHLKRQIVSTQGGLRLIADLNAYHSFVSTLRQPQVTAYFTSLKMVGELFLIDDPRELGALVRDTSRYEGTLSQEDLYELVQRRADWQKIERLVDKAVYGLECVLS